MDREVIEQKIVSLRHGVVRVRLKCPARADTLADDDDVQDIFTLNLTRAAQLCVDIGSHLIAGTGNPAPDTMGALDELAEPGVISPELAGRMKKAADFRNIAIHNYKAINRGNCSCNPTRHMSDFAAFASAVVESIGI